MSKWMDRKKEWMGWKWLVLSLSHFSVSHFPFISPLTKIDEKHEERLNWHLDGKGSINGLQRNNRVWIMESISSLFYSLFLSLLSLFFFLIVFVVLCVSLTVPLPSGNGQSSFPFQWLHLLPSSPLFSPDLSRRLCRSHWCISYCPQREEWVRGRLASLLPLPNELLLLHSRIPSP